MVNIQHLRADYLINTYVHLPALKIHPEGFHTIGILFLTTSSLAVILLVLRKILSIKDALTGPSVLLEITPPAFTEKTAYTTQQLFGTLHDLSRQKTALSRLRGKKRSFSFEIVSTKTQGIRYLVRTDKQYANALRHHLLSYLPQVRVKEVEDYLPERANFEKNCFKIVELKLSKHFAYPLQKQNNLEEHDPLAYITGMMTKLQPGELISMQMVVSPSRVPDKEKIKHMIYKGEDVLGFLDRFQPPPSAQVVLVPLSLVIKVFVSILSVFAGVTRIVVNDFIDPKMAVRQAQMQYQMQYALQSAKMNIRPARVITPFEQEAIESIEQKINQKVFQSQIRFLMLMNDSESITEREHGFLSSLSLFTSTNDQTLGKKFQFNNSLISKYKYFLYRKRLFSLVSVNNRNLLSVSEVSDLYHFPFAQVTQTENIVKVHSKELPAPLSLKNSPQLDVVFAKNTYGGIETMIGLSKEERLRHMYIIGATGTGKSTMLLSMVNQDLQNGNGVCIVDPHGDLAEAAINLIPQERIKDFIYFNPYDIKYPIGLNLLELTPGLNDDDSQLEKEFIAESVISLFRKVFSDAWASHPHRIEYILRNTIHTAFTLERPTLFTIFDLLNNPQFQAKAVKGLTDENLKNFWKYEFGKAGDYQKVKMVAPVTARIGRFLFSPSAKRILEQEQSTINFDDILDNKKILICNLSKGNIGEDTSEVMGIMILNKIQLSALKRARKAQKERNNFYLYVDEFQNFATPSFVQMLSEARKYGLCLTMAEQSTSQQKDKNLVQIVLANAGTVVTFRSANPQDEDLLLPQYRPYVDYGEIANLPSFHFYIKIAAMNPEEPFSGITMPITIKSDEDKRRRFIQSSRDRYASIYTPKAKKTDIATDSVQEINSEKQQSRSGVPA